MYHFGMNFLPLSCGSKALLEDLLGCLLALPFPSTRDMELMVMGRYPWLGVSECCCRCCSKGLQGDRGSVKCRGAQKPCFRYSRAMASTCFIWRG